tara:strand:+ start:13287 stop:14528 length:1242 start_codon:yes stop_codon:yes gene_type:complete
MQITKAQDKELIVGLDVGTSKTCALIGEVLPDDKINILGVGLHPSRGMDKGGVNDLDLVVRSIQRALDQAELMADSHIASVYLSISGRHIACQNENGMVSVNDEEVTQEDVHNVIHTASSIKLPYERRILHVFPQEYAIDIQEGIRSPIGMSGMRMEAKVHMVTCANDMAKNIVKSVERCKLKVNDLVFSAIASADAVLTEDEKDLGVCLIDIGGGTSDIVIYVDGILRHSAVLPIAGNQVTNDIAKIFRTSLTHAEQIKVQSASALSSLVHQDEMIEVPSVGGRPSRSMSRHTLAEVVEPRYEELFEFVHKEMQKSGFANQIAAGIVLTGGTASVTGIIDVAEACFGMPVRIGVPLNIQGMTEFINEPNYATAVGLLKYGAKRLAEHKEEPIPKEGMLHWVSKAKSWFKGEF